MYDIRHIIVPIALFVCIVVIIIAILNYLLKMQIIRSGQKDTEYVKLLRNTFEYRSSALKWGLLFLFGGIGLVVTTFFPDNPEALPFGVLVIFISLGYLSYYLISRRYEK